MGILKKLFSKKEETVNEELQFEESINDGHLGEAEQIANVVSAGLEKENFIGMNKHLSSMVQSEREKVAYVFEHPGIINRFYAIVLCALAIIPFGYYLFIGISMIIFSMQYRTLGIFYTVVSSAVVGLNIVLIRKFVEDIKYKKRYDIYEEFLGYKSLEFIDDLAFHVKENKDVVVDDMEKSIAYKLIPQGHLSNGNLVFMVSDKIYNRYNEKPAVYDRYFQKIIEERERIKSRSERISEIIGIGEQYIQKMQGYAVLIKDKHISKKINQMENVVSMIFHEIDVNPSKEDSLGIFLNYYLPTTEKLLETYVTLDEKDKSAGNKSVIKKEIEEAIGTIVNAYESILDKLYEEYDLDIASDIEAMELSMKQDGLLF